MMNDRMESASNAEDGYRVGRGERLADGLGAVLWWAVLLTLQIARIIVCALLVLGEPVVRVLLVPLAFLGFVITLIFGFLIGDPRFPRWGMLAFSVGALLLYWAYVWLLGLFMSLPFRHHER